MRQTRTNIRMMTLELSAADILFLKDCGIAADEGLEDTRWEIDAEETSASSLRELFESCLEAAE